MNLNEMLILNNFSLKKYRCQQQLAVFKYLKIFQCVLKDIVYYLASMEVLELEMEKDNDLTGFLKYILNWPVPKITDAGKSFDSLNLKISPPHCHIS